MPGAWALICVCVGILPPSPDTAILEEAERSFRQGAKEQDPATARKHFTEAAHGYAKLHERGIGNAALYRNWGNAELLAGNVPEAILAYRRGLHLAAGDADVRENLALARERVRYPSGLGEPAAEAWPSWLYRPTRGFLFVVTALSYLAACLLVARWFMVRRSGLVVQAILAFTVAGCIGFFWYVEEEQLRQKPLIVVAQETGLFRGNGASYPAHATLPNLNPGMEGRLLFRRGDWLQVELPSSVVGWLPGAAVLVDGASSR